MPVTGGPTLTHLSEPGSRRSTTYCLTSLPPSSFGGFQFNVHPSAVIFVASRGPSGLVGAERTLTRN